MVDHIGEKGREPDCYKCAVARDNLAPKEWPFWSLSRMYVCPTCGNKRCPKATDHLLLCTGSNEQGQPGSRYGGQSGSTNAQVYDD